MDIRILKTQKGYIVEKKVYKWSLFGLRYKWIPYVKTSGLNECWSHNSFDSALINSKVQFEKDLILNHNFKEECSHYFAMKSDGSYMPCEFCNKNKNEL
jgi:hypothetical protein